MRLVVDASVAIKWLVEEEGSETATRLLKGDHELHAPRLMVSEVTNALWRKARLGEIERGEAGTLAAAIAEMPLHWYDDEVLGADAARLALALDRPVYDCVYLALAYRIGGQVVTADARLANALAATEHGRSVGLLGGFASE
ncbi:MAG: type II toxin-antitoxin system VapC family toxin [Truepera sp.]|nr:type II toxin-antitoxin system VapC family toxin [Truepera sp.]